MSKTDGIGSGGRESDDGPGDVLPRLAFLISLVVLGFVFGFLSSHYGWPPTRQVSAAMEAWYSLKGKVGVERPWYYLSRPGTAKVSAPQPDKVAPGLTLYAGIGEAGALFVRIMDDHGNDLHAWNLDWSAIWPDATHVPDDLFPREKPGTFVHGIMLMDNGDLVFNYESLGMVRVDYDGKVVWRLPYRTHHALFRDEAGNLWVPGQKRHDEPVVHWPLYHPPFEEFTILCVSPAGEILKEISVFDLLIENDLQGLLYLTSASGQWKPVMEGDTLHLNDVELFSSAMHPGFFGPGDMMISLREISAVIVFEAGSLKTKFLSIGRAIRQHDPDFVDGDTIQIFDNRDLGTREQGTQSRIVRVNARTGALETLFEGNSAFPFFTDIMGRQQILPNGNVLLLEARFGRAIELTPDGRVAWEMNNVLSGELVGVLSDVVRLPPETTPAVLDGYAARREVPTSLALSP